jgi:hypothetical protein
LLNTSHSLGISASGRAASMPPGPHGSKVSVTAVRVLLT